MTRIVRWIVDRYGYRFFAYWVVALFCAFVSIAAFIATTPAALTAPFGGTAFVMLRMAFVRRKSLPVHIRGGELARLQALAARMEGVSGRRVEGIEALRGCLALGESATDSGLRESLGVGSRPFPGAPQ